MYPLLLCVRVGGARGLDVGTLGCEGTGGSRGGRGGGTLATSRPPVDAGDAGTSTASNVGIFAGGLRGAIVCKYYRLGTCFLGNDVRGEAVVGVGVGGGGGGGGRLRPHGD
jgi:hypothetical protein